MQYARADYAIIQDSKDFMDTVKLTDWDDREWDDFQILRKEESSDIVWFESNESAIDFLIANFKKEDINPEIFENDKYPKGYYLG